tara:strand:+ start:7228 stop:7581 length:354 start_codon:yes stop_codon:yes gene_type:complete
MNIIILFLLTLLRKDFISYKKRFNLIEKVQVHHVIPLMHRDHKNLLYHNYDINAGYNLIFMPTEYGKKCLNTKRRIHDGGHLKYNKYVLELLDRNMTPFEINNLLKNKIKNNEEIPW